MTTTGSPRAAAFQIEFDFIDHVLVSAATTAASRLLELEAAIGRRLLSRAAWHALRDLAIDMPILARPNEVPDAIPFAS